MLGGPTLERSMCTLADVGGWSLGGVYKYLGAVRDVGDGADRQGKKRKERLSGWKSGWKGRECGRFVERLPFGWMTLA